MIESQNHRMVGFVRDLWRFPAKGGSPRADCTGWHPREF